MRKACVSDARRFVNDHHYAPNFPAQRHSVGLWDNGHARPRLVGVAVFSESMNTKVVPVHTGMEHGKGAELGRLVLLDQVPMPAETWFVARAFADLRQHKPALESIVSYADPSTRRAADGTITKRGHVGRAYAALSALYRGRTPPRSEWYGPGGLPISARAISKIRNGEVGADYAARQLIEQGAPLWPEGVSGAAWVAGLVAAGLLTRSVAPGKHVYCWGLTRRARARARKLPSFPYPVVGRPDADDVTG